MNGKELTKTWAEEGGWNEPVVIPDTEGLEMAIPPNLTLQKVVDLVGEDKMIEVIG